ncbi:DivIVA domain-containing protein [Pullulanibacillus pueri]|uniref:Cell cycle protein GpsB n=1 Tax=Pullulanibacillus pueri TaxID=1437324 RepID=A0A8J2ZYL8_9BACL|nr:cell division regulator GpsB [Pullulanibacillus pueri]MBM7680997.1 DivIVA domain-containing protein [Pullulanibacillus pueri]GGH86251.1 cell cycle protein GpsB [Pullulanibacillus pueri]
MDNKLTQLTTKDILEQDFKTALRGYSPDDVDQFLDTIIKDYEAMNREIQRLRQENARMKQELTQQKSEQRRPMAAQGQTNYDILKRLSNLEKHVFGSRLQD